MTIAQYCELKSILTNTPFRIYPDGKGYYVVNENLVDRKEFERIYALPMSLRAYNSANSDGTKSWLQAD